MGWCSATTIMDDALKAADHLAAQVWAIAYTAGTEGTEGDMDKVLQDPSVRAQLDAVLSPFVRSIAKRLHDGDWDCVEEADEFERFPQEMLDYDDARYERWLREQIEERADDITPAELLHLAQRLQAHTDKIKADKN